MAKYNKDNFTYEIEEFIAPVSENDKNDWVKGVARIKWNNNPTTLDIRNMNIAENKAMKGISLSDEEADTLTDILLDEGYGTVEKIVETIKSRQNQFNYDSPKEDDFDGIYIEINI